MGHPLRGRRRGRRRTTRCRDGRRLGQRIHHASRRPGRDRWCGRALTLLLRPGLLRWAPLFVVPLAVGLVASARREDRSLLSGVATTAGPCLMTVVAYDGGSGTDWARAWVLTGVLTAYFVGTVLHVKTMIRERGVPAYHWLSAVAHGAFAVAMIWVSSWLVVFVLLEVRAAVLPAVRLTPKAVGIGGRDRRSG